MSLVGSGTGVTAESSNQLVARAGLRGRDAALIEPSLEIRVGPLSVEPVARVSGSLTGLLGDGLVVGAGRVEQGVASARRGVRDVVVVEERLDLRVGPAVEDPVLDRRIGVRGLVGSLMPVRLDLADKAVLVLLGTLLDLLAGAGDVVLELLGVPAVVGLSNLVVPVVLDQVDKVLAVGRGRVGHVVVGEPALKLSLMPLVVS